MSSGTVQVAHELSSKLNLEVGHEIVDTEWNFVRDGTVSWFHGIRFFPPFTEQKQLVQTWNLLCPAAGTNYTKHMGFHPSMYKSSSCSSRTTRSSWSKCWSLACFEILQQEWGCAYNKQQNNGGGCRTPPFHTTLLQARNPMHTIESLVTKFCVNGVHGTLHSSFEKFASALFSHHDFTQDSCIQAMGHYVVEYYTMIYKAYEQGLVSGIYRIEETSVCQVARMAGFLTNETCVYKPNYDKIKNICNSNTNANQVMESTQHQVNLGQVSLTWKDIKMEDTSLEKSLVKLFLTLGYDPTTHYTKNE
jgi:hypothetical protein